MTAAADSRKKKIETRFLYGDVTTDRFPDIPAQSVHLVVTSPPYKTKDGYSPVLMRALGRLVGRVLRSDGMVFINFGQLKEDFRRPYEAALLFQDASGLTFGQTIAWVKSIAMDDKQQGHYQPINSKSILNYCWEPIFTFWYEPPTLDRLALGVPFADKSNLARGNRGKHGDLHCAGDVWFVPYVTTGAKAKKAHRHEYPEEVVRRCIAVSGFAEGTLLEPFLGSGTTVAVAQSMGLSAWGLDIDTDAVETARKRVEYA